VSIAGNVNGAFKAGTKVTIGLRVTCSSYKTIGTTKLSPKGAFTATVPAPAGAANEIAVYRATTTVLSGRHREPTATLPQPAA
jgi:hypothetical protein